MDSPFKRSRHPVLVGVFTAIIALGLAIVAAAAWAAFAEGDNERPDPEERIRLQETDAQGLIAGDPTGETVTDEAYPVLGGGEARLSDYRGRPLVLNFFASWCVPCKEEMPALESVHRALGEQVAFLGLAQGDSERSAKALVEQTGVTYDIGRDPEGALFATFGGVNMPSTFLISPEGTVVAAKAGALSDDELRDLIDEHFFT